MQIWYRQTSDTRRSTIVNSFIFLKYSLAFVEQNPKKIWLEKNFTSVYGMFLL